MHPGIVVMSFFAVAGVLRNPFKDMRIKSWLDAFARAAATATARRARSGGEEFS
jgi:hypothetical protein